MSLVHLIQVFNDVEADIVEGLLKEHGIVCVRKYKGSRGYMKVVMGTALGVDIYVKPEDYKTAKEIIENTSLEGGYFDYPGNDRD